ncbi:MAG: TonB-dependent receptor [Candidatus Eisenbacteria bacterium]|uniref:TonB-dependent receptor n=1 Tax=Eiseniibacteriota bacterium TaxID=2212470 RepID=A0A933SDP4_UNCEI|nr:TonB-dependent receptor [Candidatus Eisenbacteria bacterium]
MIDLLISTCLSAALAASTPGATPPPADSARAPQPAPRTVRTLPPVEGRRERALLDARRRAPTASVTDVRAGESSRAIESVSELLQASAGARVVQYGGLGAFSTLSLRGAPAGQVAVYLDGVPLTSAAHGVVNLSDLPASAIDRVEVYRGFAPLGFGAAAPGGAVNLVTADDGSPRALRVAAGSFGTYEARGTAGAKRGAWSALAHAGAQGSEGDFEFRDDNGTPLNPDDDETVPRLNNRFDAANTLARVAWSPREGVRLSARGEGFRKAQGIPGLGAVQAPHPRLAFTRTLGALEAALAPEARLPGATLRAHAQRERTRFTDTEGELGLGRQDTDARFADRGAGFDLATPTAWRRVSAVAGAAWRHETAEPAAPTLGQPLPPQTRRETRAAHAGVQLHFADDVVLLHAARRWDHQSDRLRATVVGGVPYALDATRVLNAPQVGARVRLPWRFALRGNWTRAGRAPEFLELFGDQAVVQANPKLRSERGESWDAGAEWRGRRGAWVAAAEYAHFESRTHDLIAWVSASQRTVRATNIARARTSGDEASARLAWRALSLSAAFTWLDARQDDRTSIYFGRRLPQRPEYQRYARADVRRGGWSASADVLVLGEDFLDPINFRSVPERTLVGASLSRAWGRLRLTLEGKNLSDARAQDVGGYPLPGRSAFASCEWRFDPRHDTPRSHRS